MSLVIAVVNPKGGVGKTTTAINIAASLALIQRSTLLIDMDPDDACSTGLGFKRSTIRGGVFDAFTGSAAFSATIHQTSLPYLHFIPSNVQSSDDEGRFLDVAHDRRLMRDLLAGSARETYDFIVLDCPPALANLTVNALVAADTALIPVSPSQFAVRAIIRLVKLIRILKEQGINANLTVAGFLLTMFDNRTRFSAKIEHEMREKFKHLVFSTVVPMNVRVNEANYDGNPVVVYDPQSTGAKAYVDATLELLHRLGYTPKRRTTAALGVDV